MYRHQHDARMDDAGEPAAMASDDLHSHMGHSAAMFRRKF